MTLSDLRNQGITLTINEARDGFNAHGDAAVLKRLAAKIKAAKPELLAELIAVHPPMPYQALVEKIRFARHWVELEWAVEQIKHNPLLTTDQMEDLAGIVKYEARRIEQGLTNVPAGTGWGD